MLSVLRHRKTTKSKLIRQLLALCSGLLLSAAMASDCLKMHVIQTGQLGFLDEQNNPTGIQWDLLTELEARTGVCINKQLLPYARVWKSIESGGHDGGIIFRSPDREHLVEPVAPLATMHTVVIPTSNLAIFKYTDLSNLTIAKPRGNRLSDEFDRDSSLKKLEVDNYEVVAKMIGNGRTDAVAGSFISLLYQIERQGYLDRVNLDGVYRLGSREQWLQMSSKSAHLADTDALREGMASIMEDGTYDKIMTRYYGPLWARIKAVSVNWTMTEPPK